MKYSAAFRKEVDRFDRILRPIVVPRSDEGIRQFHAFESRGVRPTHPAPFFTHLCDGKKWWEWTLNEFAASYSKQDGSWFGWAHLEESFTDDPRGLKQIRKRLGQ